MLVWLSSQVNTMYHTNNGTLVLQLIHCDIRSISVEIMSTTWSIRYL